MELPSYFDRFLQEIQPTRKNRELAIQRYQNLKQRVKITSDDFFSPIYKDMFLYGSYARNTALQPIKDVDLCILLDLDTKTYTPETVVQRLKRLLDKMGYQSKTAYQRRSIRIDMSGISMDIVPVVLCGDDDEILYVPDRKLKEWVLTHPKAHMTMATQLNKESGGRYIPLVKIVKAWYRYQAKEKRGIERPQPKGFTLEVLVAQYQDADAPTYAEAFINFLENLYRDCGHEFEQGKFPNIPDPGLPNEILKVTFEPDEAKLFREIICESLDITKRAIVSQTRSESADLWREVLGNRFPSAPTTKSIDEYSEVLDEATLQEISDIELPAITALSHKVKLQANLAYKRSGEFYQQYPSGSRALSKKVWTCFSIISTSVSKPYEIRWTVENHGKEAKEADELTYSIITTSDVDYYWRSTLYRGTHFMICEIIKDKQIVARTKYIINVK